MYHLLKRFFQLYGVGFRRRLVWVTGLAIIAGIFETFGLLLVYPVLSILIEPEIVVRNGYLRSIYEFFSLESPNQLAAIFAVAIIVIFVLKNLYMVFFTRLQLNLIRDWTVEVRNQLMRYYMQSSYKLFLEKNSAMLVSNIDHFAIKALDFVVLGFINLAVNVVIVIIIILMLSLRYFLYLLLIIAATSGSVLLLYKLMRRKLYHLGKQAQKATIEIRKALTQSFSSVKETKVSNAEEFFVESFATANYNFLAVNSKISYCQRIPPYILEVVVIFCIMIMGVGVVVGNQGSGVGIVSSLGVLAAAAFRLAPLISRIVGAMNNMSAGKSFLEVIIKEAEMPEFFELQQLSLPPIIEHLPLQRELKLENLSFCYPNTRTEALKNVNLSIRRGEFIGIVGASGAGKSTFADLLLGLLEAQKGQILIDGTSLTQDNVRNWRASIGYVPQAIVLVDITVRESVAFGVVAANIDDRRVETALKKASLWDFVQTLESGIYASVGEGGKNFSGGQRQRIAIARALYRDVSVLVLDEATSALDNTTEFEITSAIENLRGECTLLVIAHRLSTLKRSDRILFFRDGALVDSGSFTELSKHKDFEHMLEVAKIEF